MWLQVVCFQVAPQNGSVAPLKASQSNGAGGDGDMQNIKHKNNKHTNRKQKVGRGL